MTKNQFALLVIWLTVLTALIVALAVLLVLAVIQTAGLPEVTRTVDSYWNVVCYHGHNWGQCLPLNTLGVDY